MLAVIKNNMLENVMALWKANRLDEQQIQMILSMSHLYMKKRNKCFNWILSKSILQIILDHG